MTCSTGSWLRPAPAGPGRIVDPAGRWSSNRAGHGGAARRPLPSRSMRSAALDRVAPATLPAAIAVLSAILSAGPRAAADPGDEVRPRIGLWYTVWWTEDDRFHHWVNCHRFPVRGRYSAGDPKVIEEHYGRLREMGVDFLILDDTNGHDNDGGAIRENIRAWFEFMDSRPPSERIPLSIGGGGEMRSGGAALQAQAAGVVWETLARRPSYFLLQGRPLLLIDTDKDHGPGDFDDPRFSVRWAYNGDNHEAMRRNKAWGWGSYEPSPALEECMSIWPGHRFPGQMLMHSS